MTSTDLTLTGLQQHLVASFHSPAATGLDAVLRLDVGGETLSFRVREGALQFDLDPLIEPDATFLFADRETAWALFSGREDAFEAFMSERFRADGYLMWAFTLMAMFRSASLPVTPVE